MPYHEIPVCCTHATCKRVIDKAIADARIEVADRVESVVRLISPEHITPIGARQIRAVLDDERRKS